MLRFDDHENYLEIDLLSQETAKLPCRGDSHLAVRVASGTFAGQSHPWVTGAALRSFCTALAALERNRRGEASLASMSPGELDLRIRSVDSCGHMAIEGSTGCHIHRDHSLAWQAVHFGFEFEPFQLAKAVATEWVQSNSESQAVHGVAAKPRLAKVHSKALADEYVRLGWTLRKELRAPGLGEPYEYLLEWLREGEPPDMDRA
jgi:hypothetical protein